MKQCKTREAALSKLVASIGIDNKQQTLKENETPEIPAQNNILTDSKEQNKADVIDNTKTKQKTKVLVPKLDFSKLPQKKQVVLKVIQCEHNSEGSLEDEENSEFDALSENAQGKLLMWRYGLILFYIELNEKEEFVAEPPKDQDDFLDKAIDEISISCEDT